MSEKRYKITVREITSGEKVKDEWQRIADSGNEKDGGVVYGYAPHVAPFQEELGVYEQTNVSFNLAKLIQVVNEETT